MNILIKVFWSRYVNWYKNCDTSNRLWIVCYEHSDRNIFCKLWCFGCQTTARTIILLSLRMTVSVYMYWVLICMHMVSHYSVRASLYMSIHWVPGQDMFSCVLHCIVHRDPPVEGRDTYMMMAPDPDRIPFTESLDEGSGHVIHRVPHWRAGTRYIHAWHLMWHMILLYMILSTESRNKGPGHVICICYTWYWYVWFHLPSPS